MEFTKHNFRNILPDNRSATSPVFDCKFTFIILILRDREVERKTRMLLTGEIGQRNDVLRAIADFGAVELNVVFIINVGVSAGLLGSSRL
jgi:hypothetical protein